MGRQAVVIIHGIGEQRPMDTLRPFVENIKTHLKDSDESEVRTVIRSKPDKVSDLFETRRISLSASRERPGTDFYEFYWAHNMRDNKFSHIISWLYRLIFTRASKVPKKLKKVWRIIWAVFVLVLIASILLALNPDISNRVASLTAVFGFSIFLSMFLAFVKTFFLNSAGDAGRYFTPSPDNIGERSTIRSQGLAFLRKLHEKQEDEAYDRIIVVGHSLGSVIAYDLLRLLWTEHYKIHASPAIIDQSAIGDIEKYMKNGTPIDPKEFQKLQHSCWKQQKAIGNKWLISDLITIGSPLASADYLIANNVSLEEMKSQRESPTCPPIADEDKDNIYYNSKAFTVGTEKRTIKILHHAAPFAVTRWSNIFFTSDYVGGPVRGLFGEGIKDVAITNKKSWLFPKGHTRYWDAESKESLTAICKAMRLRDDSNT